jgi:hypothetical protein
MSFENGTRRGLLTSERNDGRMDFEMVTLSPDNFAVVIEWDPDESSTIVCFDTEDEALAWVAANAPKH